MHLLIDLFFTFLPTLGLCLYVNQYCLQCPDFFKGLPDADVREPVLLLCSLLLGTVCRHDIF